MQDTTSAVEAKTGAEPKAPWDGAEFDEERARTLVANLRSEVKQLKADLAEAKAKTGRLGELEDKITELTQALAAKDADLARAAADAKKKALLDERDLDPAFIAALTGDDEESWTQMADLIASVRGNGGKAEKNPIPPNPLQEAINADPSGESARLALAKRFFG